MVTAALNASSRRSHIGAIDHVAGICFCRGRRKIELSGIERVNAIKWLSLFDLITDLLEQPDPCTLVDRRAGGPCQAVQLQAVDACDRSVR